MTVRAPIVAPAPTVDERADRHVGADRRVVGNGAQTDRRRAPGGATPREERDRARERGIRIVGLRSTAHGADGSPVLLVPRITAEARVVVKLRQVPRVGDEGEIAGLRLLDAGDAHDSTSPSPSRRQCNRSAMSRSFKEMRRV